jgi:glucan phosphorylase
MENQQESQARERPRTGTSPEILAQAILDVPALGYGIRYEFGIFDQEIRDGWQAEITDKWLETGNPWEICRPEIVYQVGWKGYTETYVGTDGHQRRRWLLTIPQWGKCSGWPSSISSFPVRCRI